MSLNDATQTADVDQWQKLFGISYEALDQSELLRRALAMVEWSGKPGEGKYKVSTLTPQEGSRHTSRNMGGSTTAALSSRSSPR